jgi:iron(III) transport system ATP-binding protein
MSGTESAARAGTDGSPHLSLEVEGLTKAYAAGPLAADHVSLRLDGGSLFTLLGPSGSGKTTTLRCVAGLETPDSGSITVGDRAVYSSEQRIDIAPNKRGFGMVFQSYAIWPHMSVFENAAFPLAAIRRSQRMDKSTIRSTVLAVLESVQLGHLADRSATKLSGGQQQRLALARALVMQPRLLLLDEPLSNLDAKLRDDMRLELKKLQLDLGVTTLYVTHDQTEALALSDMVGVMHEGRLQQVGTPDQIYREPATRFVAEFIGSSNFVAGRVTAVRGATCEVETPGGVVVGDCVDALQPGDGAVVAVRPELISLSEGADGQQPTEPGRWQAVVRARAYLGEAVDYLVSIEDRIEIRVRSGPSVVFEPGDRVTVDLRMARPRVFADEGTSPDDGGTQTSEVRRTDLGETRTIVV